MILSVMLKYSPQKLFVKMDAKRRYTMNAISLMPMLSRKMGMRQELSYGCFL